MPGLPLTGGCLCGQVRYEISAPLVSAVYCHCTRCQHRSGTAAAPSARVAPGALRIVAGEELVRCYQPPDGFRKCFCANCGSALWSKDPHEESNVAVRLGTFDGDPGIRPSARQWVSVAAVWEAASRRRPADVSRGSSATRERLSGSRLPGAPRG